MVKCIDCGSHVEAGNKCKVLKTALTFPPDVEVVCSEFKEKKEEK